MSYEEQLSAARFRAERDLARQECERLRARLRDSVPRDAYERKRAAWLRQIRECETALHRRREYVKKLENAALERRTVREEDHEAAEWVREHGGLDAVKEEWKLRSNLKRTCEKERAKVERQQRHIKHVQGVCETRIHRIVELNKQIAVMRPRLMPEGFEWLVEAWPRFEDDAPVRLLDDFERYGEENVVSAVTTYQDGSFALNFRAYSKGERVKRPAPKVIGADRTEIRVGDTVYLLPGDWCDKFPCFGYHGGEELEVFALHADHVEGGIGCRDTRRPKGTCFPQPSQLTHRAPVIAADGRPLRVGDTVWHVKSGSEYTVKSVSRGNVETSGGVYTQSELTHERPVADTWERLEDDASKNPFDYCKDVGHRLDTCENSEAYKARDLVRRAKKLAGVNE